ncbi:hypothetical protein ACHAWF_013342 [Thalassiosira exigua]
MPATIYLVTGGCRSGKSSHAQALCEKLSDRPVYLATSSCTSSYTDADMKDRIERHQKDRGDSWTTIEEPRFPSKHLKELEGRVVLIDCLTLWLTNWFMECNVFSLDADANNGEVRSSDNQVSQAAEKALDAVKEEVEKLFGQWNTTYVIVTNEVGSGTHGSDAVSRAFVDHQGWLNQFVAKKATMVTHMVAGCANVIKDATSDGGRGTSSTTSASDKQDACMLDKYLSSRGLSMDPKGYFMMKLEDKRIVASFYSCIVNDQGEVCDLEGKKIPCCSGSKKREPMKVWRARTAKELTTAIFEQWKDASALELSIGHAAYIGREAQRAETCLYNNTPYQQD